MTLFTMRAELFFPYFPQSFTAAPANKNQAAVELFLFPASLQGFGDAFVATGKPAAGATAPSPIMLVGPTPTADASVPVLMIIANTSTLAALPAAIYRLPLMPRVTLQAALVTAAPFPRVKLVARPAAPDTLAPAPTMADQAL